MSKTRYLALALAMVLAIGTLMVFRAADPAAQTPSARATAPPDPEVTRYVERLIDEGRRVFRHDTFGDEAFWGDQLQLHRAIVGQKLGGVGPGMSPKMALSLGLKVDAEAVPADLAAQLKAGKVNLDDPASTVALLKANAVVGVTAFLNADGSARSVGIQCALCHSTVDDSFAPGIGRRRDGWPNRDLDVGAIVALAPDLSPLSKLLGVSDDAVRKVLRSWGPGKYDAELVQDGKAMRPDGKSAATVLPRGVRPRRRELAYLHGMGRSVALERVRGDDPDARAGHVLRSAIERRQAVSDRREGRSRQYPQPAGPGDVEARGAALLPARAARAGAACW